MKKVLIATPTYDGKIDVHYAAALSESIKMGLANNINFVPIFIAYDALIQRARNDLIAMAINSDVTDMIWIDADQEWDPQWLLDLLAYECDVVGGAVVKKADVEQYNIKATIEQLICDEAGLMQVESIGTGFLRLSRKAFEYLWDTATHYTHNNEPRRWVFEVKLSDGDIISEDVLLCRKLREGGFSINLDPKITCNHIGVKKWTGNFHNYLKRLKPNSNLN